MYRYGYVVREKNPGSVALMKTIPLLQLLEPDQNVPSRFQRFFLSFDAQKQGFIYGCRPFIGLDGCHLKGKFPGVLITAIAIDSNYGVFPLALCICEGESSDSWGWFLHQLYLHIGLQDPRKITFMTDRQKGVLNAIEKWWPRSSNRFCVRHLVANLQGKFRGKLCADYVWKAAKSSNKADFLFAMSQLRDAYPAAYDYMMQIPFKHWSRHAFDEHVKSDHVTNNVTKSFNSWADKFRGQPALTMFENIRRTLMKRMYKRLSEAEQWGTVLPPLVMKKIAESQDEGRFAQVMCASQNEYEVKDGETHYIVYLEAKTCTCGMWIVSGIPCKHAMAVITSTRKQAHDFVHEYLKKEKYIKAYSNVIHPIPDESLWPEINFTKVLPPECKKLPGRPKKNRKRGPDEPPKHKRSNGGKCSGCKQFGHNIRTCPMKKAAAFASKSSTIRGGKKSSGKTMGSSTFEVGSCSKAPKKRRTNEVVNMQLHEGQSQGINNEMQVSQPNTTAAPLFSSTNASQRTQGTTEQAFTSQSQALQPVTINAPFYTSRNGTQSFQSRSNPGTVAGLDSDWSAF